MSEEVKPEVAEAPTVPVKRPRGRPKGSKTVNRKVKAKVEAKPAVEEVKAHIPTPEVIPGGDDVIVEGE